MENGFDDDPLETFWALGNKVGRLACLNLNMNHKNWIQETKTKHKYDKTFHKEPRVSFVAPPTVTTPLRIESLFKLVSLL